MSHILYYSNHCENSKKCIHHLGKYNLDDIHYLCIDKRVQKNNATYLIIEDKHEVLLPPTVTKVPALLLLNKGHHGIYGSDIYKYFEPKINTLQQNATALNEEPVCFSLSQMSNVSDQYSFLDQSIDELSNRFKRQTRLLFRVFDLNDDGIINNTDLIKGIHLYSF